MPSNLTTTTPPSSRLLITGDELLERLGMAAGDTAKADRLANRASAAVIRALGFEPGYQTVSETFRGETGTDLNLTARPFVALVGVLDGASVAQVAGTDFEVQRTGRASGEVYLYRPETWNTYEPGGITAEWTVNYRAGWWLPGSSGSKPADVSLLPEDLIEAAFLVALDLHGAGSAPAGVVSMSKGESKVTFRNRNGAEAPRQHGLPAEAFEMLIPYRPIAF